MSDPTQNEVTWAHILKVNGMFVCACLSLVYGWLFWSRASLEWYGFWFIGFCGLAGGAGLLLRALYRSFALIRSHTHWARYSRQGVKPRGDRMAGEEEILRRENMS